MRLSSTVQFSGFCSPGMVLAGEALLAINPNPTRVEIPRISLETSAVALSADSGCNRGNSRATSQKGTAALDP